MSFADLVKTHATYIVSGPTGELIEYKKYPSQVFQEIFAHVTREPADIMGNVLANRIRVFISKTDLDKPNPKQDYIQLQQRDPGDEQPLYRVISIVANGETPGCWTVEAIK